MAEPIKVTLDQFADLLKPGQAIIVQNGERGILNTLITGIQIGLFKDLNKSLAKLKSLPESQHAVITDMEFNAKFTHAMMIASVVDIPSPVTKDSAPKNLAERVLSTVGLKRPKLIPKHRVTLVENFYPKTHLVGLDEKVKSGMVVALCSFKFNDTPQEVETQLNCALRDASEGVPYPIWKLFYYYGYRWGWQRTFLGRPIMSIFKNGAPGKRDDDYQVCSGMVWKWMLGGMSRLDKPKWLHRNDALAHLWYPGRMAGDRYYMVQHGVFMIIP